MFQRPLGEFSELRLRAARKDDGGLVERKERVYTLAVLTPEEVTGLLRQSQSGNAAAQTELLEELYNDLRRIAAALIRMEKPGHTLQPTALVHEVYTRVFHQSKLTIRDRQHFLTLAGRAMRRVLVDHARRKRTKKRGEGVAACTLEETLQFHPGQELLFLEVDEALEKLAEMDPRLCQVVEMRFFAGLTEQEIAESLGVTERTVKRDWKVAQAWLRGWLGDRRNRQEG